MIDEILSNACIIQISDAFVVHTRGSYSAGESENGVWPSSILYPPPQKPPTKITATTGHHLPMTMTTTFQLIDIDIDHR